METRRVFVRDPLRFLSTPATATTVDALDRRNVYVAPLSSPRAQQQWQQQLQ